MRQAGLSVALAVLFLVLAAVLISVVVAALFGADWLITVPAAP